MNPLRQATRHGILPALALIVAVAALLYWWFDARRDEVSLRLPGTDEPSGANGALLNPVLNGKLFNGGTLVTNLPGEWPQFRGPNRDGKIPESTPLARSWPASGPRELWSIDCGEGYAGPAIHEGRVYLMDYDRDHKQSALRCLSLADGAELWRYSYPLSLKRNHGMTRTVPAVSGQFVVAIDPRCNVVCADAQSGELRWGINLVHDFGTTVPPWYTGQCPFIDGDRVILAPGGRDTLLMAVELATGSNLWQAPNPRAWKMTHSSVMPMEFAGQRFYVYCGSGGVAGISATNGAILWDTTDWKISIANIPSPLVLPEGRIFLSGGYNAGSLLLQLIDRGGKIEACVLFRLPPEIFGATQHTPILVGDHVTGVRPNGQFVSLGFDGKVAWTTPVAEQFGLGPYLVAGSLCFAMDDSGKLSLYEIASGSPKQLSQAQVLHDRESWGPMALAGSRLLVRDFTHLACLEVGSR